jgi:hypothetical protein
MQYGNYYANGRKKKYNAWSTKKSTKPAFVELVVETTLPLRPGADTSHIKSVSDTSTIYNCGKADRPVYTGTLVKGISTLHKSNAVPIISQQDAIDHANMRR